MTRLSDLVREQAAKEIVTLMSPPQPSDVTPGGSAASLGPVPDGESTQNWYERAFLELVAIRQAVQERRPWDLRALTTVAAGISQALAADDRLVGMVMELREETGRDHIIANAVNVAVLGAKIAMGLNYSATQRERVALAGLLHDIGMLGLPERLLNKVESLSEDEQKLVRQHPQRGIALLAGIDGVSPWLRTVVMQEHERWNGSGYPRGLKGEEIDEVALIVGLADVLEAVICPRPYRRGAVMPHEALKALLTNGKVKFPNHLLKALVDQLSIYPIGTTVRLSTGDTGVVSQLNKKFPLRPILLVRQQAPANVEPATRMVDLSANVSVQITEVMQPMAAS